MESTDISSHVAGARVYSSLSRALNCKLESKEMFIYVSLQCAFAIWCFILYLFSFFLS